MSLSGTFVAPAITRQTACLSRDMTIDGERTTVGTPMVGDPWFNPMGGLLARRTVQYAAAMARKHGLIGDDASGLDATIQGTDTVVFIAADSTQREVARFTIPARVLAFNPHRAPLRLADQREMSTAHLIRRASMTKPRPLTPVQAAILRVLQASGASGQTSAMIAANHFGGRYAKWSLPKLKALARRGLVELAEGRARRWRVTSAGAALYIAGGSATA